MRVVLEKWAYEPTRGHDNDAGMDLRTPRNFTLMAHSSEVIDTGVAVEIPPGYFGKLESKSGLNVRFSIVSHGGVIDSGYQGNIVVKLYNEGNENYFFDEGDKLVQLIIIPCLIPSLEFVDSFDEATERGKDGFGSTGK